MASLTSQSIASSYEQLLHVDRDGGGNGTTHVAVKDGDNGTTFPITLATDAIMITSTNRLEFGDDGTYIHQSADGVLDLVSDTTLELNGGSGSMKIDTNSRISLSNNDSGSGNTVFGKLSGDDLASGGNYNSFFGENAGHAVTTGDANVAIGHGAMDVHTTGNYNIAIGYNAFGTAVGGSQNIAIGSEALGKQTESGTGSVRNIAIGDNTNYYNVTGEKNIMIGTNAGLGADGQSHDNNVAVGDDSQNALTTGEGNVSMGTRSLNLNKDGSNNVAVGFQALRKLGDTANSNIGIGTNTLENITADGVENCVAIGFEAMRGESYSTTGINGTVAVGYRALDEIESGNGNTAVGFQAGDTINTGAENTILGYNCDVASGDNTNNVILGNNLTASDNDNRVYIGNDSSYVYNDFNSAATWTHSSDKRQKKEIKDDTLGLDFINDIRPVTYKHKSPSEFPKEWSAYNADDKEPMGGDKTIHGLIAQEVKQALDNQGVDTFSGWGEEDDGRQHVSFESFVLPLIKAVQELSAKIEELEKKV